MRLVLRLLALFVLLAAKLSAGQAEAKAAYMRGAALEKKKDYAGAIKEYEAALEADSHYVYAHKQLGNCHYFSGDKESALEHYDAYLAVVKNDAATQKFADGLRASRKEGAPSKGGGASASAGPNNAIYTNATSDALSLFNLGYKRAFGENNALVVEGATWGVSVGTLKYSLTGFGLGWHFGTGKLKGFFIGPKLTYFMGNMSETVTSGGTSVVAEAKTTILGYGADLGYQWLWDSGFMLNIGSNLAMANFTAEASASSGGQKVTATGGLSGFVPSGLLCLGFAF